MEGQHLSFVEDLSVANDFWHMKARVIRKWEQTFKVDMVLLDERGKKIQATIKKSLWPEFEQYIKEDAVIVIRKFGVGEQKDKYRVVPVDHKINFFKCTSVQPVTSFQGSLYGFEFVPFVEINQFGARGWHTVDVLGRIAWCGDLDIFKGKDKESKRMNFELQDLDGQVIKCTVWRKYADQVNKFICNNNSSEMVICILQHAKIKRFNREITVQNDMYGTRLFLNEDIEEANNLRRSLILRDGAGASSQTILSSQIVYPFHNEFVIKTERKHVDEISEARKETHYVVLATIRMIEEDFGWFYVACRQHNRKVLTKEEFLEQAAEIPSHFLEAPMDSLWCLTCNDVAASLVPKFKVQLRVQDHTGSVSLVMFDKDVSKVLGLSANDIRERQLKAGDVDVFPYELNVLLNKLYAFKIAIAPYNLEEEYYVYTVSKLCDDPEIIAELQDNDQVDEVSQDQSEFVNAKLLESPEAGINSKDGVSFTADFLATDLEKDSPTSPGEKRPVMLLDEGKTVAELSTSKRGKKKLQF